MKRVALFMHGGVTQPHSTMGVPAITGLVQRLAEDFDITVYTTVKPDGYREPFLCGKAQCRFVAARENDTVATVVIRSLHEFRKDHLTQKFSLVHGFWGLPGGATAVLAGKFSGLKSIVSLLGGEAACLPFIGYGNLRKFTSRAGTLWTCRNADELVFLTRYQLDGLRRFNFKRARDMHFFPFGVEDSLFQREWQKPQAPPYRFIHIGHMNRVKDQRTLLLAFREISRQIDCSLEIIGEDTLNGTLKKVAEQLGISHLVSFSGFVPHGEIPGHLAKAHVMLHTSLYEGQGVVFVEAAAAGVLLCGTRVGLLSDIGDLIAVTVDPGDYQALARGVLALLDDPAQMTRLESQSSQWALAHDADWTASQYADLYDRCLQNTKPAERLHEMVT